MPAEAKAARPGAARSSAGARPGGRAASKPDGRLSDGAQRSAARAGGILSYFTRHRTAANLLLVVMIAAGLAAFPKMRAQFFPDVVVDDIEVSVAWPGAGAEDVDAAIVQVLEPALLAVEGVTELARRARARARPASSSSSSPAGTWAARPTTCRPAVDAVTQPARGRRRARGPPRRLARPGDRRGHHRPGGRRPAGAASPTSSSRGCSPRA